MTCQWQNQVGARDPRPHSSYTWTFYRYNYPSSLGFRTPSSFCRIFWKSGTLTESSQLFLLTCLSFSPFHGNRLSSVALCQLLPPLSLQPWPVLLQSSHTLWPHFSVFTPIPFTCTCCLLSFFTLPCGAAWNILISFCL